MTKQEKIDRFLLRLRQELMNDKNEMIVSALENEDEEEAKPVMMTLQVLWHIDEKGFEIIRMLNT